MQKKIVLLLITTSLYATLAQADTLTFMQNGVNDDAQIVQVPDSTTQNDAVVRQDYISSNVKVTLRQSGKNAHNIADIYQAGSKDSTSVSQSGSGMKNVQVIQASDYEFFQFSS